MCVCVTKEDCYRLGIVAMAECLISHLWSSPTILLTLQSPVSEIAYDNEIKHLRVITDSQASSGTSDAFYTMLYISVGLSQI